MYADNVSKLLAYVDISIDELVDNTIDLPWRNFLSAFEAKFQREVLLFLEISEFPYNTVVEKNSSAKN